LKPIRDRSWTSFSRIARVRVSRTCSLCCHWSCQQRPCRSRIAVSIPTIRDYAARRSNTWKACCRLTFAIACGRLSAIGRGRRKTAGRATRSSPTSCVRTNRSCSTSRS
jgi:hypothetical protein